MRVGCLWGVGGEAHVAGAVFLWVFVSFSCHPLPKLEKKILLADLLCWHWSAVGLLPHENPHGEGRGWPPLKSPGW